VVANLVFQSPDKRLSVPSSCGTFIVVFLAQSKVVR
jgi:hypothetical protein